jgi:hypothetical protein
VRRSASSSAPERRPRSHATSARSAWWSGSRVSTTTCVPGGPHPARPRPRSPRPSSREPERESSASSAASMTGRRSAPSMSGSTTPSTGRPAVAGRARCRASSRARPARWHGRQRAPRGRRQGRQAARELRTEPLGTGGERCELAPGPQRSQRGGAPTTRRRRAPPPPSPSVRPPRCRSCSAPRSRSGCRPAHAPRRAAPRGRPRSHPPRRRHAGRACPPARCGHAPRALPSPAGRRDVGVRDDLGAAATTRREPAGVDQRTATADGTSDVRGRYRRASRTLEHDLADVVAWAALLLVHRARLVEDDGEPERRERHERGPARRRRRARPARAQPAR